jgi:Lamin Tail Domain
MNIFLKKILLFLFLFLSLPQVYAEVFITSVLPNTDNDATLEYIELYNSSRTPASLSGYTLSDTSGKTYTFGSGVFLPSKIFTPFFRPQTKIILNNTTEEVFLKSPSWETKDSIAYASSLKWQKITFLQRAWQLLISDESFLWHPKLYFSDEIGIPPINTRPTIPTSPSPEIQFSLQQPSYLLISEKPSFDYVCDTSKSDCKVNFDLRPSFSTLFPENLYECEIDFWFLSTESKKCNPSTVTLREGENKIRFQIFLKSDRNILSTKTIHISNTRNTISTWENQEWTHTSSETLISTSKLPSIILTLQQPSYVFWNADAWLSCDRNKSDCKINFDISPSFDSGVKESDFFCEIESALFPEKIKSCNPGTLEIPKWEHAIVFRIFSKSDYILVSEKRVSITNFWSYLATQKPLSISKNFSAEDLIFIRKPEILIQSGITEKQGKFFCTWKKCKINLQYQKRNEKERCLWNFGKGIYKESSLTRCNPGIIEYEGGIHPIKLRVYQSNNKTNYMESRLVFDFFPDEPLPLVTDEFLEEKPDTTAFFLNILVQGKIGKNKTLSGSGSSLDCESKESCSVNFIAEIPSQEKNDKLIEYFWDFWNGESFIGKNPKSLKFSLWNSLVTVRAYLGEILLGEDHIDIRVYQKQKIEKASKNSKKGAVFTGSVSIVSLLPNPVGNDIREWIEIKNTGEHTVSLDTCFFKNGRKKSKFPLWETLVSGMSLKIFRVFSNFSLGNKNGNIELFCGDILQDNISWGNSIQEGMMVNKAEIKRSSSYDIKRDDFSSDTAYKTFVEKTGKLSVSKLKSGIKLSGETLAFQNIFLRSSQGKKYKIHSDKNGIFKILIDQNISLWPISFIFSFSDSFQNTFSFSWNKELIISQADKNNFFSKYIKKTRKKKASKPIKETSIEILPMRQSYEKTEKPLSFIGKIGILFVLSSLTLLWIFFILPRRVPNLEGVLLSFQTRQKVLLIL